MQNTTPTQQLPQGTDKKMALCLSSYKRLEDLQRQIYAMMAQTYQNFHLFVAVKGLTEYIVQTIVKPLFQDYIDQDKLTIRWYPNKNQLSNLIDTIRHLDTSQYHLYLKIDDDDFYSRDYLKTINQYHQSLPPDHSSYYHQRNWVYRKYNGNPALHWEHPWYGPSLVIAPIVMSRIMQCENNPELIPYYLDKYRKGLCGNRTIGFNEDTFIYMFLKDQGSSNIAPFVRQKNIPHYIIIQKSNPSTIRGGLVDPQFKKTNIRVSQNPNHFEYTIELQHPHWHDTLHFTRGRGHRLSTNDQATILYYSHRKIVIHWDEWDPEIFIKQPGGHYEYTPAPLPSVASDAPSVTCVPVTLPSQAPPATNQLLHADYTLTPHIGRLAPKICAADHEAQYIGRQTFTLDSNANTLRLSLADALDEYAQNPDDQIIFAETNIAPLSDAHSVSKIIRQAIVDHPGQDIYRLFATYEESYTQTCFETDPCTFTPWQTGESQSLRNPSVYGSYALIIPSSSRRKIASLLRKHHLPVDITLEYATATRQVKTVTATKNLFYRLKPN